MVHRSFPAPAFPWCPPRQQLPQAEVLRQDGGGGPLCQGMQGWILLPAPRAVVLFPTCYFSRATVMFAGLLLALPVPHCPAGHMPACVAVEGGCAVCGAAPSAPCVISELCAAPRLQWFHSQELSPGEQFPASPPSCPRLSHLLPHPVLPPCCTGSSFCTDQRIVISASSFQTHA